MPRSAADFCQNPDTSTAPTLLERDFNIPPLAELLGEVERIRVLQRGAA